MVQNTRIMLLKHTLASRVYPTQTNLTQWNPGLRALLLDVYLTRVLCFFLHGLSFSF